MRAVIAVILILIATLLLLAATVPTFDFDEALYRRVAEEMKQSHDYFVPTWDGKPFYEKPPTYIWSIVAASFLVDGRSPHVSVFASRLPSVICSLATVFLLAWFWRRMAPQYASAFGTTIDDSRRWLLSPALPLLAYGTGLFAMGGAASVVLDPMLTLFLLAPLLVFAGAVFRDDLRLTFPEIMIAGLGMAAATAVKGLVGIVLPALALGVHALLTRRFRQLGGVVSTFAVAVAAAATFYAVVYQFTGPQFFREFFIRQHFIRATTAIQGHRGPLLFHVAIVALIGGPLVAFVLRSWPRTSALAFAKWGFPLTWTATVIVFYSAMATKLPNYTWPVWPALVLTLCILIMRAYSECEKKRARWLVFAAYVCLTPIAGAFILLGAGADVWIHPSYTPRAAIMLSAIEPVPISVRIGLVIIGCALAMQILELRAFGLQLDRRSRMLWKSLAGALVLNCLALSTVSTMVLPFADRSLRGPLVRLSRDAWTEHAGEDLTTVGLFSPTVSSSYGGARVRQVGRMPRALAPKRHQQLLLMPAWQAAACREPDCVVLKRDQYLMLCQEIQ
jgi:4-amino-4-deoxy-L-arabinose transferase-like glycosyltransferase